MNMRDFWAAEAVKMRDTSHLGIGNALPINSTQQTGANDDFKTGWWLEGNVIVVAAYVFNGTLAPNAAAELLLKEAQKIFKDIAPKTNDNGVPRATYTFDFRYKLASLPRYEYGNIYTRGGGSSLGKAAGKWQKYMHNKGDKNELLAQYATPRDLPEEYYIELFEGSGNAEGGAHFNPHNRAKSAHFTLAVSAKIDRARTVVHEILHSLITHTWVKAADNPMYDTYNDFFQKVGELVDKQDGIDKTKTTTVVKAQIKANVDKLADSAADIRENIMTTVDIIKDAPKDRYPYLYIHLPNEMDYLLDKNMLNNGKKMHRSQMEYIVSQLNNQ